MEYTEGQIAGIMSLTWKEKMTKQVREDLLFRAIKGKHKKMPDVVAKALAKTDSLMDWSELSPEFQKMLVEHHKGMINSKDFQQVVSKYEKLD